METATSTSRLQLRPIPLPSDMFTEMQEKSESARVTNLAASSHAHANDHGPLPLHIQDIIGDVCALPLAPPAHLMLMKFLAALSSCIEIYYRSIFTSATNKLALCSGKLSETQNYQAHENKQVGAI